MDIAELGISVRSDGVAVATNRLEKLDKGSARADRSASALTGTFSRLATVAGTALAAAFSVSAMFAFQDGLAEVSTLVDTTTFSMADLSDAALKQGAAFGNVQGQVKAYYQIISAGAGSVAAATDTLTASNKLAIGGVTDIATAADGLTSVLNAYGDKVENATAVSDALFIGMKDGKTTIGELASGLGKVAPLAAQTGVGFDELVGSISALTKGGISTNESITGVRAVLAAIAKPTSEATKLSKALGIEFNSTALESQGLVGFLENLVAKTGGSTDALAQLFGGVEALVPVMALSGQAGKDLTVIMGDMANKAGATQEAFDKMAASPGFQSGRLMSGLTAEALSLTSAMGEGLVPVITLLADNSDTLVHGAVALSVAFGTYVVAANAATVSTINFSAALAVLTGPAGLLALLAGGLAFAEIKHRQAEDASRLHDKALRDNAEAIGLAENASQSYRQGLQAEINAQISSANAAVEAARTKLEAARSLASSQSLFDQVTGFLSPSVREARANAITVFSDDVGVASGRLRDLQSQLFRFGDTISMTPASDAGGGIDTTIPKTFTAIADGAKAANDNVIDLNKGIQTTSGSLSEWEQVGQQVTSTLADGFTNLFTGLIDGTQSAQEAIGGLLKSLGSMLINRGFQMLLGGLFGGGGGLFGGLFGGGGGYTPGFGAYGSFDTGGYTGNAPINQATGIVHGQEYVLNAAATRSIGLPTLNAMNSGRMPANNNTPRAANSNAQIHFNVTVDARGAQQGVGAEIARALSDFSRNELPQRVQLINADPHGLG